MRGVLQRVSEAKVVFDGEITGEIGTGILLLLGISSSPKATPDISSKRRWVCVSLTTQMVK
ncbi:MAG: D-aminoacyl-tRNA deacylase [Pyrinomonadaceae bacterium]